MYDFTETLTRQKAAESHAKLADLKQQLFALHQELRNSLNAAAGLQDPNLSSEGLQNRRRQLEEAARQKAAKQLEQLQAEQRMHTARIRDWAETKRPKLEDDALALQKASLAWDRARAMLDAGRSMPEVIASATDPSMLLAIREWGPDYLRAQFPREPGLRIGDQEPDTSGLVRSAELRLAELAGGDVAKALGMIRDVEVLEAGWVPSARTIEHTLAGVQQDPHALLSAAYEAKFAEQQASAGYQNLAAEAAGTPAGDAA